MNALGAGKGNAAHEVTTDDPAEAALTVGNEVIAEAWSEDEPGDELIETTQAPPRLRYLPIAALLSSIVAVTAVTTIWFNMRPSGLVSVPSRPATTTVAASPPTTVGAAPPATVTVVQPPPVTVTVTQPPPITVMHPPPVTVQQQPSAVVAAPPAAQPPSSRYPGITDPADVAYLDRMAGLGYTVSNPPGLVSQGRETCWRLTQLGWTPDQVVDNIAQSNGGRSTPSIKRAEAVKVARAAIESYCPGAGR